MDFKNIYDLINKSNVIVGGIPGSGKTIFTKLVLKADIENEIKTLIVDEENEFKGLSNTLNGIYVNSNEFVHCSINELINSKFDTNLLVIRIDFPFENNSNIAIDNLTAVFKIALNNNFKKIHLSDRFIKILLEHYEEFKTFLNDINILGNTGKLNYLNSDKINSYFNNILLFELSKGDIDEIETKYNIGKEFLLAIRRSYKTRDCLIHNIKYKKTQQACVKLSNDDVAGLLI
ncbi:hypothetical protein [Clostridium estertheticum]|uniref:hypothetical protein n=1 Tax=Clostridium estertheticum TaxID=238834 RepID=UPI001C0E618B|nr:hypothetical protein [Clostridium estertheticum]MBU3173393.1 hypothetical protein [Clostridium estertheticum]